MEYLLHIGIIIGIYAILAMSLDLVVGYTGLLSAAHAAFYGIGAYVYAIATTTYQMGFFAAVLMACCIAGVGAFLIGIALSRFRDDYYVLASMGFSTIVFSLFLNLQSVTRGPLGIPGIPRPEVFGFSFVQNSWFIILILATACCIGLLLRWLVMTPFGHIIRAIREDEKTIQLFGVKTELYKLIVFVLSAMIAAIAGCLFASYITFIDPSSFALAESIFILSVLILGGLGSLRGAVIGAVLLVLLPEVLRFVGFPSDIAAQMRQFTYGLLLVLLMIYKPTGIAGKYKM